MCMSVSNFKKFCNMLFSNFCRAYVCFWGQIACNYIIDYIRSFFWNFIWFESDTNYVVNMHTAKSLNVPWKYKAAWASCLHHIISIHFVASILEGVIWLSVTYLNMQLLQQPWIDGLRCLLFVLHRMQRTLWVFIISIFLVYVCFDHMVFSC